MIFIKKYWPFIAIVVAFLIGMFLSGGGNKDLEKKFERERELLKKENQALNRQIKERALVIREIREKMTLDSLENSKRLSASNAEIKKLKYEIRQVNFKNHSADGLDRLRDSLFRANPLP